MMPNSLRICSQGRYRMLTLSGVSSTVLTVRLDTKCCNIMFAASSRNAARRRVEVRHVD